MTQVVQARCPHCRNLLRIPAEWLDRPMRCKHCRQVFQARDKAPAIAAGPAAMAPGIPMAAPHTAATSVAIATMAVAHRPSSPVVARTPKGQRDTFTFGVINMVGTPV